MLKMQDYLNNLKNPDKINYYRPINISLQQSSAVNTSSQSQKSDTVEIADKNKKKKIIKYTAIVSGVVLSVLAFFKRKEIGEFFSKLFKREGAPPGNSRVPEVFGGNTPSGNPAAPPGKLAGEIPSGRNKVVDEIKETFNAEKFIDLED